MLIQTLDDKSVTRTCLELLSVFAVSLFYFYVIVLSARQSLVFEMMLCVAFPVLIHVFNRMVGKKIHYRVVQLILIESFFMLFVLIGKVDIQYGPFNHNWLLGYGFRSLFLVQFIFFMIYQYKVKSYFGLIRTALFLILLIPWFSGASLVSQMDSDGRFFFSGAQAPEYIIAYYCFWVIGIPLVDSKTLPNFLTAVLHIASVIIALVSQEFFHARLLTASHLFILDYLLSYSTPYDRNFGILNQRHFMEYKKHIKPFIDKGTLYLCSLIFIGVFWKSYM